VEESRGCCAKVRGAEMVNSESIEKNGVQINRADWSEPAEKLSKDLRSKHLFEIRQPLLRQGIQR
jgi:hypothetical protein